MFVLLYIGCKVKNKYSEQQLVRLYVVFSQVLITAPDICRLMRFFRLLGHAMLTVIRLHVCRFVWAGSACINLSKLSKLSRSNPKYHANSSMRLDKPKFGSIAQDSSYKLLSAPKGTI